MLVSLLSFLLALTLGQRLGFAAPLILGLFALAAIAITIFLMIEYRVKQPMVKLDLFRNSDFSVSIATAFMCFIALGAIFVIPFYLQDVLGYTATQIGLLYNGTYWPNHPER